MLIEILLGSQVVALATPWFERVFGAIDETTPRPFRTRPRRPTWTLYIQSMIAAAVLVGIYIYAVELLFYSYFSHPNSYSASSISTLQGMICLRSCIHLPLIVVID